MRSVTEMARPGIDDIINAHSRISGVIQRTPVIHSDSLNEVLGCDAFFKCENLQDTGAFKLRGASNAVLRLRELGIPTDVATHSSGNHGAALARAARLDGRRAHVVMPRNAVQRKVDSVREQGGHVIFCESNQQAREAGLAELVTQGLIPIPPYDHEDIIAGQGTAALEFLEQQDELDILMTPVGGGGLVSGSAIAARALRPGIRVVAAEPEGAADTAASFKAGARVDSWNPQTIADGLRALVGEITFPIILDLVDEVLTVSEEAIREGVLLAKAHLDLLIEPSSSTVIGAILEHRNTFAGRRVGMVISGGNIDLELFPELGMTDE